MNEQRQKKPRAANSRRVQRQRREQFISIPNDTLFSAKSQGFSPHVSSLLDQAIEKQERHAAAAAYHLGQAERARIIRRELETLIPDIEATRIATLGLYRNAWELGNVPLIDRLASDYRVSLQQKRRADRLWSIYGGEGVRDG